MKRAYRFKSNWLWIAKGTIISFDLSNVEEKQLYEQVKNQLEYLGAKDTQGIACSNATLVDPMNDVELDIFLDSLNAGGKL